ncbi:hypothetical protein SteCoe_16359 [Stentor coeruleus]|uniref:SUN domain-containing protein n=1 Tax=Stentor coeruleus TaxID=5963 RepID=A0A1R2C1G9_9CILI|nr:hypothetical protein SteCoe_16359 [Stentor coeruleus]
MTEISSELLNSNSHAHIENIRTADEIKCEEDLKIITKSSLGKTICCIGFCFFLVGFLSSQLLRFYYFKPLQDALNETFIYYDKIKPDTSIEIDYASSSNGGKIFKVIEKESYQKINKIDEIISNDNSPGKCWAFQGSSASVSIQLFASIVPTSFEIYHLNSIDYSTAPKRIKIYGLSYTRGEILLGEYFFDLTIKDEIRKSWYVFPCESNCVEFIYGVKLEVLENYGGFNTCIYQIKVHGKPGELGL